MSYEEITAQQKTSQEEAAKEKLKKRLREAGKQEDFDPEEEINTRSENFAKANALRLVDLADEKTLREFLQDINSQTDLMKRYAKPLPLPENANNAPMHSSFRIVQNLLEGIYDPHEDRENFFQIWEQTRQNCRERDVHGDPMALYYQCAIHAVKNHFNDHIVNYYASDLLKILDDHEKTYGSYPQISLNEYLFYQMTDHLQSQITNYQIGGFHLLWDKSNKDCHTNLERPSSDTESLYPESYYECIISSFRKNLEEKKKDTSLTQDSLWEKFDEMNLAKKVLKRLSLSSDGIEEIFSLDTWAISDKQLDSIINKGIQNPDFAFHRKLPNGRKLQNSGIIYLTEVKTYNIMRL